MNSFTAEGVTLKIFTLYVRPKTQFKKVTVSKMQFWPTVESNAAYTSKEICGHNSTSTEQLGAFMKQLSSLQSDIYLKSTEKDAF